MKILICTNHSYMFWQFRKELTEALLKKGEVVLSTPFVGHEEDLAKLGCKMVETPIDRRGINPITDLKLIHFYKKLMKEEKPDLVVTYSIKPNVYATLACQKYKIPYCVHVQGLGTAFEKKGIADIVTVMYKKAVKKAKTTFFENSGDAEEFVKRGIQKRENQTILNGAGVNLDYHSYQSYPENDIFHFLYLGRIMKEKGIDELFDSVRRLKDNGYSFVLDLVGFYEDEYGEEVKQLQDDGIVVFHGFQSDPRPYYKNADCVVLPSYHEGMSNVLLEGASAGRPLITSNIHGCMEAVEDNVTGYLCEVKNSESLYEKMEQMLKLDSKDRENMGLAGRKRMQDIYSKEHVVEETVEQLF